MARNASTGRAFTLLGMVVGVAVGAAVALVYSPNSGEGNRKQLNQWAHNRLEDAQSKLERKG